MTEIGREERHGGVLAQQKHLSYIGSQPRSFWLAWQAPVSLKPACQNRLS